MESLDIGTIAALGGLLGGVVLGFAARWGRFCTLNSIEQAVLGADLNGLRMWALAISVAIACSWSANQFGYINLGSSFYLTAPVALTASIAGGLIFGLGMAFVGTCGFGCLARIGGGDLKSVVTFLVMGITAYATMHGATAYVREYLFPRVEAPTHAESIPAFVSDISGLPALLIAYGMALVLGLAAIINKSFLLDGRKILTAVLVGLTIVYGWIVTGYIAIDEFDPRPLENYTFSAPMGDAIIYVMTLTGASLKFGIGAVFGVVLGAFLTSISQGHFRWEACDDAIELRRQMIGGFLMGIGSVTALGCSIGQGLSAMSTLAWSAPVTVASIFIGAWFGLHYLVQGSFVAPLKTLFNFSSGRNL